MSVPSCVVRRLITSRLPPGPALTPGRRSRMAGAEQPAAGCMAAPASYAARGLVMRGSWFAQKKMVNAGIMTLWFEPGQFCLAAGDSRHAFDVR